MLVFFKDDYCDMGFLKNEGSIVSELLTIRARTQ